MTDTAEAPGQSPTPDVAPELRPELASWCDSWKNCFQNVVSQVSGNVPTTFEISRQPLSSADSDVWYVVVASGAVSGDMTLRLPAATATQLAKKLLGEPEPPSEGSADTGTQEAVSAENKEALEELLRQVSGLTATALGATAGAEVRLDLSASAAPAWAADATVCIQTRDEAGTLIAIEMRISPALASALQPRPQTTPSPSQTASPASESPLQSNYARLMDVGLNVKLRFGSRRMLLRDVLALSAGIVVELDNTLHSPVDLLLDGHPVAHGEVVVVDGKYGLRVTSVVDSGTSAVPV
jgi:flagellar motor switch protein FliN